MTELTSDYENKIKNEEVKIIKPVEIQTKFSPAPCSYDSVKDEEIIFEDDEITYVNEEIVYGENEIIKKNLNECENPPLFSENNEFDKIVCKACNKTFSSKKSLKLHEHRNPVCTKWLSIENPSIIKRENINFIDCIEDLKKSVTIIVSNEELIQCKHCLHTFSNIGNLNKHYKKSIVCNYIALDEFIKNINLLQNNVDIFFNN